MEEVRKFLFKNISKGGVWLDEVTEALFLYELGRFPGVTSAAKLRLLGPALWLKKRSIKKKLDGIWWYVPSDIKEEIYQLYKEIEWKGFKEVILELFDIILEFNAKEPSPTCVVKYHIVTHPLDRNIFCIMYFTYWPVQLFPAHMFDYEPIYVFVRMQSTQEFEPLLVTFNADPGTLFGRILPLRRGKRPGHIIQTYFDWESDKIQIGATEFNPMADYMTNAFGGEYLYKQVPKEKNLSHVSRLIGPDGRWPSLLISNKWHAYQPISDQIPEKYELVECEPFPLKAQDLFHIEWDIRNPFQVPFLYPTVGGKNPLMHMPLDLLMLYDNSSFKNWMNFAIHTFDEPSKGNLNIWKKHLIPEEIAEISKLASSTPEAIIEKLEQIDSLPSQISNMRIYQAVILVELLRRVLGVTRYAKVLSKEERKHLYRTWTSRI